MLKSSNNVETNVYALEIAISAEDFDAAQNKAFLKQVESLDEFRFIDLESEMDSEDCGYLVMVTERGVVKRTKLSEFRIQRKGGKIAISLDDDDELVFVKHTNGSDGIIVASHNGMSARFDEADVRPMGRNARGVKGITLADGDYVVELIKLFKKR